MQVKKTQWKNTTDTATPTPPSVRSLLLTRRQICNEADAIFYTINDLNMSFGNSFQFLCSPGQVQRRQHFIEEIAVHYYPMLNLDISLSSVFEMVSVLDSLRILRVHLHHAPYQKEKDAVTLDKSRARPAINKLPNLAKFSLSTTALEWDGSTFREIEAEVRAMINNRDNARIN